jgi:hypothetical protein
MGKPQILNLWRVSAKFGGIWSKSQENQNMLLEPQQVEV